MSACWTGGWSGFIRGPAWNSSPASCADGRKFASPAQRDNRRMELLKQILLDLREQTDWLVDDLATKPIVVQGGFDAEARQHLEEIAETAAAIRTAMRPGKAIWRQMLPTAPHRRQTARQG